MKTSSFVLSLVITLILCFGFTFQSSAQSTKYHEVGLRFSDFNSFGFVYKEGKDKNKLARIRLVAANFSLSKIDSIQSGGITLSIAGGAEYKKAITPEFNFVHGIDASIGILSPMDNVGDRGNQVSLGLGYMLGFQYNLNKNVYIGAEFIPNITYSTNIGNAGRKVSNTSISAKASNVAITLAYQFGTEKKE